MYTGAEIGFATVTLLELGAGFLAGKLGGGGGGSAALAFAGGGTMSGALALEGEGVLAGAIQVVKEGVIGLGIVNLLEAAASGSGGKKDEKIYNSASELSKDIRKNKPKNSPDVDKWYKKGGCISIDENGVWTYHDWEGNSVSYPDGYPDFKNAKPNSMVRQEVDLENIGNYKKILV